MNIESKANMIFISSYVFEISQSFYHRIVTCDDFDDYFADLY